MIFCCSDGATPDTMVDQLSLDLSINADRRLAAKPIRSDNRTICGANLSSRLVDVVVARAAAGRRPVHNPTKYVFE